jgi:GH43 family beta-xylosidase
MTCFVLSSNCFEPITNLKNMFLHKSVSAMKLPTKSRQMRFIFHGFILWSLTWASAGRSETYATEHYFANPICEQADPWIAQDQGRYLACFSDGNSAISIQVSDRLTQLGPKHIVWTAPATGLASREIWAPELHKLDGRWYVYFAASDGQNKNHKMWVLQSQGTDPLGPYSLHGPLYTGDDPAMTISNCWAIDLTILELGSRRYAIWSGWPDGRDMQYLYIAPMKNPLTMAGPRVRICANDDYVWERVGEQPGERGLNEAPEVLQHAGRTFVTYSCSGSWQPSYKLGMLELRPGGDPLDPKDWTKFSSPVFQSSERTFGVGHNSFVKSPDGTEDWLIYHAKWDRSDGWRRVVFAQPFKWSVAGLPLFGDPVTAGQPLPLPAGENIPVISGRQTFQFKSADDLTNWSYFGHHQLVWLRDGSLHLGSSQTDAVNGFRSGEKIILDGGCWTNFTVMVHLRDLKTPGNAGLLFRTGLAAVGYNAQRGYYAGFAPDESKVILGWMDGTAWHEIASTKVAEPLPDNIALSVNVRAEHIQVCLQGKTVIETNDTTFTSGSIGLRVMDAHAAFSQLQIKPLATSPPN